MSEPSSDNIDRDELHDRLIDGALRELVGGERPPDLLPAILAASSLAEKDVAPASTLVAAGREPAGHRSRFSWTALAVAACLTVGAAILLLPGIQAARDGARRANQARFPASTPAAPAPALDDDATDELRYYEDAAVQASGEKAGGESALVGDELAEATALATAAGPAEPTPAASRELGVTLESDVGAVAEARGGEAVDTPMAAFGVPAASAPAVAPAAQPAAGGAPAAFDDGDSLAEGEQLADKFAAPEDGAAPVSGNGDDARYAGRELAGDAYQLAVGRGGYAGGGGGGFGGRRGWDRSETRDFGFRGHMWADASSEELRQRRLESIRAAEAGRGPGEGGDQYARIVENPFLAISAATTDNRLSTFSIDVDTASYANVRQFLMQSGMLPPPDAVRIEELVNYFDYDYTPPTGDVPFASNVEVAACPWAPEHRLVRVGIKGREMPRGDRPKSNLVFLIDVSGSMDEPNKLPLLVEGMRMLTRELGENDRVAIVVYASSEGLALESTRGDQQQTILGVLDRLSAGGSTAGGAGIQLAYRVAEENFIDGGVNRVILCTDGDFNVGVTSPAELERLAETKAKDTGVFLTVLGFGRGNLNDAMMEQIANHGNGNYHYVDNQREARKVLVEEMTGTLVTIAKDVKIQVEFNPAQVAAYRLIGYENRVLAAEDFNDDKKDAGEIGAGHTVTALYEVVPAGVEFDARGVDELRYAAPTDADGEAASAARSEDAPARGVGELLTLKIRYKEPDGDTSTKLEFPVTDSDQAFSAATPDFQFAAAVASFGMLLRGSENAGASTFAGVLEIAESASRDRDEHGYRREFVELVQRAKELAGQ